MTLDERIALIYQAAHAMEGQKQSAGHDEAVREDVQIEETHSHGSHLAALTISLLLPTLMATLNTKMVGSQP
jgi:hypothetical protein